MATEWQLHLRIRRNFPVEPQATLGWNAHPSVHMVGLLEEKPGKWSVPAWSMVVGMSSRVAQIERNPISKMIGFCVIASQCGYSSGSKFESTGHGSRVTSSLVGWNCRLRRGFGERTVRCSYRDDDQNFDFVEPISRIAHRFPPLRLPQRRAAEWKLKCRSAK